MRRVLGVGTQGGERELTDGTEVLGGVLNTGYIAMPSFKVTDRQMLTTARAASGQVSLACYKFISPRLGNAEALAAKVEFVQMIVAPVEGDLQDLMQIAQRD